jgi:mannose-6-phosphate isomerase-like protein (cupin superfamily)
LASAERYSFTGSSLWSRPPAADNSGVNSPLPWFDRSKFDLSPYMKRIEKPWGFELHWTQADLPYMGKVLHINAGARLSLQVHDSKSETWLLMAGRCKVAWENADGKLIETELEPGRGYTCNLGQKHRLEGITDCEIIEVSTPEEGTTWRLHDDFERPHETPRQRAIERGEAPRASSSKPRRVS